jgi:hypothetical protein
LSALVKENPLDFIQLSLDSHPAKQIRKTDLSDISLVPVLFHSGYLTINEITNIKKIQNGEEINVEALNLRIPNMEVSSNYIELIFMDSFKQNRKSISNLSKKYSDSTVE